jgi:PAS domain S-box-containing protein
VQRSHSAVGQSWLGFVKLAVATGIAYFLAGRLGLALRAEPGVAVFWPAAGIAVGALIALGPTARLPVAAAVVVATTTCNLMTGRSAWLAIAFGSINAGQVLLTTWLLERWFGSWFKLEGVQQVLGFLVSSAIGSAIAAVGAAISINLIDPTASPLHVWRVWFAACSLGIVTVAPLLIGLADVMRERLPRRELVEGWAGIITLAALSAFLISLPDGPWATALPEAVVFPFLLWVAIRCRPVFAAAAALVVGLTFIGSTTLNIGHFDASKPLAERIVAAQTFVLAAAILVVLLAALFAERRRSEQALKKGAERLHQVLDGAELGAFSADLATGQFECDMRAALFHGHSMPPTTIKASRRFVHPGDLNRIDAAVAEAQHTTRGIWKAEYRVRPPPNHPHAGQTRWVAVEGSVACNSQGTPLRLVGVTRDITERKRAERALAERNVQLALAGKAGLVGTYAHNFNADRMQVSEGYAAIHGLPEGTTESSRGEWMRRVHPVDLERKLAVERKSFRERRREYNAEYRIDRDGEVRWIESRGFISYDSGGSPQRIIGVNIDITERKRAEEHQRILVAELDHRVKNVLATVSAVAGQTLETSSSMSHFVAALDGRIQSMAATHELLSTHQWRGMSMAELVRREFAAYAGSNNTKIDGPDVMLSAEAGQAMGMVIHELVTNAAKYGALSDQSGRVSVRWYQNLNGSAQLILVWQETGGPRVESPMKTGYGTGVIRDLIPYEFGGTVDLAFAPAGVRCRLEIPFDRVSSDIRNGAGSERLHHAESTSALVS